MIARAHSSADPVWLTHQECSVAGSGIRTYLRMRCCGGRAYWFEYFWVKAVLFPDGNTYLDKSYPIPLKLPAVEIPIAFLATAVARARAMEAISSRKPVLKGETMEGVSATNRDS